MYGPRGEGDGMMAENQYRRKRITPTHEKISQGDFPRAYGAVEVALATQRLSMSIRRFRKLLQQAVVVVGFLIVLNYYLKGDIDEWFARPYSEFQYPLEINLPQVVKRIKGNESVDILPITELSFEFSSPAECPEHLLLAVVVKSAVSHGLNRMIIRSTWGNLSSTQASVKLFFHVGATADQALRSQVEMEHAIHKDMIQSDFIDTYYNNTFKSIMGLRWAHLHCNGASYVLYVDDDYYVSLDNLVTFLQSFGTVREKFWMGYLCLNGEPDRRHWPYAGKWQVSRWKYPYRFWPPFMNGGSYLLSADLATDFYLASKYIEFIAMDDVFLGIIARKLGVKGFSNETLFPNPGVPRLLIPKDDPRLKYVVANHRFGKIDEVEYIWNKLKNS